ncbi:MAG: NgoFVII family restriction endonuclease [Chloracidobacterium sp.]|nr:NgoFVII family restriction endonuclease [Chloracidobacterium sp.]MCO5333676.1 hypothetical protein [Pyrinomonadaceae bacterium]
MFTNLQNLEQQEYYLKMLGIVGSLTRLFSANSEPYIDYRIAENLFCKAFEAENLSRSDVSADAKKEKKGIGIKTFLDKGGISFEKIAEFNKNNPLYKNKVEGEKILEIAKLRNDRLSATKAWCQIEDIFYHCVTRGNNKIYVYECNADPINLSEIQITKTTEAAISFNDGTNEYRFVNSKSTLYRKFERDNVLLESDIDILDDPFELLEDLLTKDDQSVVEKFIKKDETLFVPAKYAVKYPRIYLPLYSVRNGEKYIPEKSGLNQWRADGRPRNSNEVYIPIPSWIHKTFPSFFPPRKVAFNLRLSNDQLVSAAVCQDNGKALMSNPNSDLGEWLLRGLMNLDEKTLVEYKYLDGLGVDSVVIDKIGELNYEIDVVQTGSFDDFKEANS